LKYVTVSAKIDRELHRKLKRYGIPISMVIKRALEEEVQRKEEEELRNTLGEMQRILKKIPQDELIQAIRSSREER